MANEKIINENIKANIDEKIKLISADDSQSVRKMAGNLFSQILGCDKKKDVFYAEGENPGYIGKVIEKLETHHSKDLVLITDFNMPAGNGDVLVKAIRGWEKENNKEPMIIIGNSGNEQGKTTSGDEAIQSFRDAGANGFINKQNINASNISGMMKDVYDQAMKHSLGIGEFYANGVPFLPEQRAVAFLKIELEVGAGAAIPPISAQNPSTNIGSKIGGQSRGPEAIVMAPEEHAVLSLKMKPVRDNSGNINNPLSEKRSGNSNKVLPISDG